MSRCRYDRSGPTSTILTLPVRPENLLGIPLPSGFLPANGQWCRQNADHPGGASTDPAGRTRRASARPSPSLAQAPCPTPRSATPQVGIGPDATPERKKPSLVVWAELSACTTANFLWLPDLGSNQGPTD